MRNCVLKILIGCFLLASLPAVAAAAAGAGAMLSDLADALEKKDVSRLRELIDIQSMIYVSTVLHAPGYPREDPLKTLSNTTGPDSFHEVEQALFDRLGNGMEQNECRLAWWPGCPWVPEAVGKAVLITESPDTAIYAVDNKRGIRSWLILSRESGRWRVWAIAESDREARFVVSREFRDTLARVRKELPGLVEEKARARKARSQASDAQYKERMAEIKERNNAEKAAKDAVECRVTHVSTEKKERLAATQTLAHVTMEVHNRNSFAIVPRDWELTLLRPDGSPAKTFVPEAYRTGTDAPLPPGARKTISLSFALIHDVDEEYVAGWESGKYSVKAALGAFGRQ